MSPELYPLSINSGRGYGQCLAQKHQVPTVRWHTGECEFEYSQPQYLHLAQENGASAGDSSEVGQSTSFSKQQTWTIIDGIVLGPLSS